MIPHCNTRALEQHHIRTILAPWKTLGAIIRPSNLLFAVAMETPSSCKKTKLSIECFFSSSIIITVHVQDTREPKCADVRTQPYTLTLSCCCSLFITLPDSQDQQTYTVRLRTTHSRWSRTVIRHRCGKIVNDLHII